MHLRDLIIHSLCVFAIVNALKHGSIFKWFPLKCGFCLSYQVALWTTPFLVVINDASWYWMFVFPFASAGSAQLINDYFYMFTRNHEEPSCLHEDNENDDI